MRITISKYMLSSWLVSCILLLTVCSLDTIIFAKNNSTNNKNTGNTIDNVIVGDTINIGYGLYELIGSYKTGSDNKAFIKYILLDTLGAFAEEKVKELFPSKKWKKFNMPISVYHNYKKNFRYKAGKLIVESPESGDRFVLFKNVKLKKSNDPIFIRLFPSEYGRNYIPFVNGSPNFLRLMLIGDKKKVKGNVEIELDIPKGIKDYGVFNGGEPISIKGEEYVRYHIPLLKMQVDKIKKRTGHASVTCWFNADSIKDKKNRKIFYRIVIAGKKYTNKETSLKILPPLPESSRSKRFQRAVSWATFGETYKGTTSKNKYMPEKIFPEVYNLVRSIGINTFLVFAEKESTKWRKYILKNLKKNDAKIWANIPKGFLSKFMYKKGWETNVIKNGVQEIGEMCGDYFIKMKTLTDAVHFDFEPGNAEENPLWEHVPTKKMFAKKYGYNLSKLTKKLLQGKLRQYWMIFRTWQIGEALRVWAKYLHSINPEWKLTVSQGNGKPNKHIAYGVYNDIPKIIHMPQIYGSNTKYVTQMIVSLQDRYPADKFFPIISAFMVADKGWPAMSTPKEMYSQFISIAMLGCVGGGQWPDIRRGIDMEYIWEISRAMRDISYFEDYVYDGEVMENIDIKTLNNKVDWEQNSFSRAYKLNQEILIAFNNFHPSETAEVRIQINSRIGNTVTIVNPVINKLIVSPTGSIWNSEDLKKGVIYKIPPSSVGILIISKNITR